MTEVERDGRGSSIVSSGWVVAGAMLLSSGSLRWFRTGPGSRSSGLALADSIRSGVVSPGWGVWVAAVVYSLVGLGGVFVATAVLRHPAVVVVRGVATLAGLGVLATSTLVVNPLDNWSLGPTIALLAFFVAVSLSAIQLLDLSRK